MRIIAIIMAALGLTLLGGTSAFAQVCKGLSKSACQSNASCSHVGAHTRKNGSRVKAFCRAKPGATARRSTTRKASTRTASTKKAKTERRTSARSGSKRRTTAKKSTRKVATKRRTAKKKTTRRRTKKAAAGT